MRRRPLVSVITPAHNAAATIGRCHDSLLAQSFTDWEHIVIDDASVDGTAETVARLAAESNGQVKLLRLPRNSGAGRARNLGIEAAAGRFVAFLDADDFWLPEKLASQVAFMEQNRIWFSYGAYYIANGAAAGERKIFQPPDRLSYRQLLEGCPIGCLTAMYDSEALGKRFMPEVRRGQDWGLWLQLARVCEEIAAYPGVHAVYYNNPASISSQKFRKLLDVWQIYRRHEGLPPHEAALRLSFHLRYLFFGCKDFISSHDGKR